MANDPQAGSRTFLAIVLAGIVLALIIAAYLLYGSRHQTSVKVERPAPAEQVPAPAAPPMAAPEAAPPMAPEAAQPMAPEAAPPAAPAEPPANQ